MLSDGGPDSMSKLEVMGDKRDRQALKQTIEDNLRKVYQDLLQEEVPDRFSALINQLRQQTRSDTESRSDSPPSPAPDAAKPTSDAEGDA